MDKKRIIDFVENSFLKPLLGKKEITDISYNGNELFYEDRSKGRRRAEFTITPQEVGDFLRQIANFAERQFTYLNPTLDVSFGRYRLNASFYSVVRVRDEKTYSFSLRLGHYGSAINDDPGFFPGKSRRYILDALSKGESIVISGETGSGKTELQKYLLLRLPSNTRVINIDNVEELELSRDDESSIDLTSWHVDERNPHTTFSALIKNALRNNPDYLLVAEIRGEEMFDALNAVMSGHPIITTIHASSVEAIPHRMARLAQLGGQNLIYEDLLGDIYNHFTLLVHVVKEYEGGEVRRHIATIGRINKATRSVDIVYTYEKEAEE